MISEIPLKDRSFTWIDVESPQPEDFNKLSSEFGLPYLLVQDTLRPEHLPKYEQTEEGHFLIMRYYDPQSPQDATTIQELTRKIAFFITDNRLMTIHRVHTGLIDKLSEKSQKNEFPKTLQGLVHMLTLEVIRSFEEPISRLQDMHDEFETDVLSKQSQLSTIRIYHFRRQLFVIKRLLNQTNDSLFRFKEFWKKQPSMLQDLKENIEQVYFRLDEITDNFEHLFQLQISLNDQRANEVMRVLTVFSSVLLPLNFIASFYGMNFVHLPGLQSPHALAGVTFSMVFVSVVTIWYFRKRGWFRFRRDL
jgi:magnesium transporter